MTPDELESKDNVRAPFFYLLRASTSCPACGFDTCVLAIAIPDGHEILDEVGAEWSTQHAAAILFFVAQLPGAVSHRLQEFCAGYRRLCAESADQTYWANHCSQCAAEFDEEALHSEPDVAFLPYTEVRASRIEVHRINQAFQACVRGVSLAPSFFDAMRRV